MRRRLSGWLVGLLMSSVTLSLLLTFVAPTFFEPPDWPDEPAAVFSVNESGLFLSSPSTASVQWAEPLAV